MWPTSFLLSFIVIYAVSGTLITLACSKADRALDAERNFFTAVICVTSYVFAFMVLGVTLFSGVFYVDI